MTRDHVPTPALRLDLDCRAPHCDPTVSLDHARHARCGDAVEAVGAVGAAAAKGQGR